MRAGRALLATLVLAIALLLGLPLSGPAGVAAASAEEPRALVTITLDAFSPSLPSRTGEITVSGRVRNTSKKPIFRPRAYFWRNQAPITDREGFDQAVNSAANDPLGARKIASFDDLYSSPDRPYLAAGETAGFTLRVKVADLDLPATSGIYLMGVHVLANEQPTAVGRARVFVPILSRPPRNSLQMTTIVMLNTRPSLICETCSATRKAVLADAHLADELAPGGRLERLIEAAGQPATSFAVDPELVQTVTAMASGYQIQGDSGTVDNGPGRAAASRWLERFSRLADRGDGFRLVYGSVDIAALTHAGQLSVLQAATEAAKNVPLTKSLPLLVWPGRGAADDQTLAAAVSLHPKAVLLSDTSTRARAPLLRGVDGTPIVNYTSAAFDGGPGPEPSDTPAHLRQRVVAESWLQAATSPRGTTLGRVRVVSTAAQAAGDGRAIRAPWVRPTTLSQLLAATAAPGPTTLTYSRAARGRELTGSQLAAVGRLSESWATWQDLLVDPKASTASAEAAVARAASVRLRRAGPAFEDYLGTQQRGLDERLDAVQISVTHRVLTPKSQTKFPITIRNTLTPSSDPAVNAVQVRLDFESANRQRLTVQPLAARTIAAGQNLQQQAVVDARTNGTVRVRAQLRTVSGRPVGQPAIIDVQATQAGTVGWFIAVGAGVVLLGTTALRIRQVTRERARAAELAAGEDRDERTESGGGEAATLPATRSAPPADPPPPDSPTSIDV